MPDVQFDGVSGRSVELDFVSPAFSFKWYLFISYRECPFGIICRVGSSHLNLATGQNICKSKEELLKMPPPPEIMNLLPSKAAIALRKKKYNFACKRHFEKPKKDDVEGNVKAEEPIDNSPLPKMRKLIDFSNKVYIAPLTTVGNLPFRRVMKKCGADISEFFCIMNSSTVNHEKIELKQFQLFQLVGRWLSQIICCKGKMGNGHF
jgi:hypothetical protein